ncbi:MAG: FAD-dependent oxidoreductase [Desulfosarcina sp.]
MHPIWQIDTDSPGYRTDRKKAGVIVIGAGLTGLLAAWHLRQSGVDVLVLEAREVGTGTSAGSTGKITSQHRIFYHPFLEAHGEEKARMYADANQWAVKAYIDLVESQGIDCHLHVHPAYVYSDEDRGILERENEAALKLGLPSSLESVPVSANSALCFQDQAQFHPRAFLLGLADKIATGGGGIIEHKRVVAVDEGSTCTVRTEDGETFESDYVIFATLFPILDHAYYAVRLTPVQHFGVAYTFEKREFDGMFIGVDDLSFRYHEDVLIVVGGDQRMGHAQDAYRELDRKARAKFRVKAEVARWSAHDYNSGDLVPYIGPYHPGSRRRYAATGFKAWGLTHAMIAAKLLTDQIGGRENPWSDLFSPSRTSEALKAMIEQTKSAIKHMMKFGTRCPHMGCALVQNQNDNTFDCPCHGSRFDAQGEVLWGPAVKKAKVD